MSFNVWGAGANESKPVDETAAAIRAAGADLVGVQETRVEGPKCTAQHCPPLGHSVARKLARKLGFHYYDQTGRNPALWANAVLSRYPIVGATPHDLGVELDVDGRSVYAFNLHLDDSPYQPYQLLDIPYGGAPFIHTEAEAIRFARRTRVPAVRLFRRDLRAAGDADAAFVFGDFNEPSWRDWTKAAVARRKPADRGSMADHPGDRGVRLRRRLPCGKPRPGRQAGLHLDPDQQADGQLGPPRQDRFHLRPGR